MANASPSASAIEAVSGRHSTRSGGAEMALAAFVVGAIAMLIVPLPTWLLDLLLAMNLSLSVALLLVVLYVPDALGMATFPTVLLLTTLFRLALNVSTSRLVLLQANAGEVVKAFGSFVVRGNYLVGGILFLILTVVQFVVVAKGAERVAEVAARFVLDAMPGRQIAIDADLRTGAIESEEAQRRRRSLSRESQFYGAMDGAMKFVKGDVVASLIITVINLVGGLGVGVFQHGMSAGAALKRYGLLTIGDGLVSQIPALVLSTAAGVLVTRVASEEPETPLGSEIARQLFGVPKALAAAAMFVFLLALVPGLPALPFLVLSVAFAWLARERAKTMAATDNAPRDRTRLFSFDGGRSAPQATPFVPALTPWSLAISNDLMPIFSHADEHFSHSERGSISRRQQWAEPRETLRDALIAVREQLFVELGVPIPPPRIEGLRREGPPHEENFVPDQDASRRVVVSLFEIPAYVISLPSYLDDASLMARLAEEVAALLRARAADFLGISETQALVDALERIDPAAVRAAVPKTISVTLLGDVLHRLASEHLSIRDLKTILGALASAASIEKDPVWLTEIVRSRLRRALTFRLTAGGTTLGVILLDAMVEDTVRRAVTHTSAGVSMGLPPAMTRDLITAIRRAVDEAKAQQGETSIVVVLTSPDIRPFVRQLTEVDLPQVWIVSVTEILPNVSVKSLARATLAGLP